MTNAEEQNPTAPARFHAVILHSDGEFKTESFDTVDLLTARLRELINQDVSVSCFCGARLWLSKPPLRHLITPEGNIPLFDANVEIEPDDTGYLGVDPANFESPPQVSMPRPNNAQQADDFFAEDDGAINIFDSALPDPDN